MAAKVSGRRLTLVSPDDMRAPVRSVLLVPCILWLPGSASAFEEVVKRELVDAGVHVPVLTRAPELTGFVEAEYPAAARAAGRTASVRLVITIAADGAVDEATVPAPVGDGFDEAALAAVRRFRFSPAEIDGKPAPVQLEYVYHFVLRPADATTAVDGGAPLAAAGDGGADVPPTGAGAAAAGTAVLKGALLTRGTRKRIVGGTLWCDGAPESQAVSDVEGRFELAVPAGECRVRVVAPAHQRYETTETLAPGETAEVNYFVRPEVIGFETVVRGQREKKEVVQRTFTRAELQKVPGTFGDPVRVIQNFPGVARAPFVLGQMVIRGAAANQSRTFFDGVEIPLLFHLGGGPSVVNGEFLERVDFLPGGFGARYGRAVGGVIDVQSRSGATDTWHAAAKVDLVDSSLFVESPIAKDVSAAAAFRRSYVDALVPLAMPLVLGQTPELGALSVLPVYWDYQVRVDGGAPRGKTGASGASSWRLFAFGSDDRLSVAAAGAARNIDVSASFQANFHRLVGQWAHRSGPTRYRISPYVGYDVATIDLGFATIRGDRYSAGLRNDLEVELDARTTVRAGVDVLAEQLEGRAELPAFSGTQYVGFPGAEPKAVTQTVAESITTVDGALYAEADLRLGPVTVTPGLRASHVFVNRQTRAALDPRLWVRLEPAGSWTALKGSLGLYTQPPAGFNMSPAPFGTPTLVHEKAFQSSLGFVQRFTEAINVDVTAFYNRRFENVSAPGPTTVQADGSVVRERFANEGLGRAYGLEVLARHEVTKHFFGWLAYTLARSEQRIAGSGADYVLTSSDQTHILTAVASYRLPHGWEVGGRFRYVTGNPRSPLLHDADVYQADSNRFAGTYGAVRSIRAPDFLQLDLRVDKAFTFERWTLGVYLDVQNVTNARNVEASFTDYRYRQRFDVPGIPILPVLGVKATL